MNILKNTQRLFCKPGIIAVALTVTACSSNDSDGTGVITDDSPTNNVTDNSQSSDMPGAFSRTAIGDVLVFGDSNRTLYTFENDQDGISNCSDACLVNWPAVEASEAANSGNFATITRDDGSLQWAYKNRPVYYYQGDAGEGDINGESLGGVWYVARPDPTGVDETSIGATLVGLGSINDGSGDSAARREVEGLTLYTFRNDTPDNSTCNDQCALNWPPHFVDKGALPTGEFSLITRADGSLQWAYGGQALYYFQGDSVAGDINGNGINGVWDVAVP